MDGANDRFVFSTGKLSQGAHNSHSSETIEARGWFIKQQDLWICDKLHCYRCSFSLSSRDKLSFYGSYEGVLTLAEAKLFDQLFNPSVLLCLAASQFKSCRESQDFSDSKILEQKVILHNIACEAAERLGCEWVLVIKQNLTT